MKKLLLSFLFVSGIAVSGYGQIFSQDFTSSTTVSDYVNSSAPTNGQFNAIGMSNASNGGVSIASNALRLSRTTSGTSGTAQFTRNNLSATAPTFLAIKFTMSVTGSTTAATTAATFYVGSGLPTTNSTDPTASNAHSRFGINLTSVATEFSLRNITGNSNSSVFSGAQQIFFVINNSGGAISYKAPDNSNYNLSDDTWDLWVGTTRVFTGVAAWGAGIDLNGFRLMFGGTSSNVGAGNIDVTNIEVHTLQTLPVSLTSFTAKANLQNINLAWATASEKNNSHFDVLRSGDGKTFTKIGEVKGAGTTDAPNNYTFVDKNALPSISYYQLKQVDNNGKPTLSEIVAVKSNVAASNFKVATSRQDGVVKLTVFAANEGKATFKIYDLNGRKLTEQALTLSKGYTNFSVPFSGVSGLHIASLTTANETVTQKFIQ